MRIALAQLDARLGDVAANEGRVREAIARARAGGADLVVFPELYLSGYALAAAGPDTSRPAEAVAPLAAGETAAIIGFHERNGSVTYNSAVYAAGGAAAHIHRKLYLV